MAGEQLVRYVIKEVKRGFLETVISVNTKPKEAVIVETTT
jgi:hypothetical protein